MVKIRAGKTSKNSNEAVKLLAEQLKLKEKLGKDVVEIGSGDGRFSRIIGKKAILIDKNPEELKKTTGNRIVGDVVEGIPLKRNSVDSVIAFLFLDLFNEKQIKKIIEESHRILRKGGVFVFGGDRYAPLNSSIENFGNLCEAGFLAIPIIKNIKINPKVEIPVDVGFKFIELKKAAEITNRLLNNSETEEKEKMLESIKKLSVLNSELIKRDIEKVNALITITLSDMEDSMFYEKILKEYKEEAIEVLFTQNFVNKMAEICKNIFSKKVVEINTSSIMIDDDNSIYGFPVYLGVYKKG